MLHRAIAPQGEIAHGAVPHTQAAAIAVLIRGKATLPLFF